MVNRDVQNRKPVNRRTAKYRDKQYRETDLRLLRAVLSAWLCRYERYAFKRIVRYVEKLGSMTIKERAWVVRSARSIMKNPRRLK